MKSLYFKILFALICFAGSVKAQQNHFIYIQTDNKLPFYIKYDKKILSSSGTGYLIIPKLQEGPHEFIIGFPKNEWPEQYVTAKIENHDAGYSLKNFGDKGWGLFNMQTLEVTMAGATQSSGTVKQTEVIPQKKEIVEVPKANTEEVKQKAQIQKLASDNVNGGTQITYLDITGTKADTVKVFIPADNNYEKPKEIIEEPKAVTEKVITRADEKKEEVVKPVEPVVKKEVAIPVAEKPKAAANVISMVNSDCKSIATGDDFIKLRKKMVAEGNDDDMVTVARKTFKTKCFTTEQIKNLGALFLKDEGRYKLFDAAYPFVSDTQNFGLLQAQLTTDYYISRFKAMI